MFFLLWCSYLILLDYVFFFKQKTAYEMRISDWSSDVCSSDLHVAEGSREDQLVTLLSQVAYDALGIGTFGYVFNKLGLDLVAQRLLHFFAAYVLLPGPAGLANRADIDEAYFQGFLPGRPGSGRNSNGGRNGQGKQRVEKKLCRHNY